MRRPSRLSLATFATALLVLGISSRAEALPACTDQGLAFYPLATPLRYLDTAQGPTAWWPQGYPLSAGQTFQGRVNGIPSNARALVARVTLSNYRGEWPECSWYESAYFEGYRCEYEGDPSTSARYPRLRISTALPAPTTGAGVLRVGSGPSMPTEQLVTFPLATDGSFALSADSVFDTRVEVVGYYAPPGPGGLYMHLLPRPSYLFSAFAFTPVGPNTLGRSMNAGETQTFPAVGTWSVTPQFGGPITYTIPANAALVAGNYIAYLKWDLSTPQDVQRVIPFQPGTALPETGLALQFWDGFGEGGEYLVKLDAYGQLGLHATAATDLILNVSGYFSPQQQDDGNGPGLLFHPTPHSVKGATSLSGDDGAGPFYVPTYDQDATACGTAAAGRLRFIGTGDGNGQEFQIATQGFPSNATSIATAADTNDEVTFVRQIGASGGFDVYVDNADRSGATLYFEIDTFGTFGP